MPVTSPVPLGEAETILEHVSDEGGTVLRYQAVLRVRGKGPEGRFSASQVLIFERPQNVRVELLGAFGSTRWVAVTSGVEILVWFPGRREFLQETRVGDVVGVLLGIELSPEEVMAVLSGTGLPLRGERALSAVRQGDITRIELKDAMLELEGEQVKTATCANYRVSYPTRWKATGRQVPDRVELKTDRIEATLRIEDLDVNVPLHPQAFRIKLPEDAERLELDQIEGEAVFVKTRP